MFHRKIPALIAGLAACAALAPAAASAATVNSFTGNCKLAGVTTMPSTISGTCTGWYDGGAATTYQATVVLPSPRFSLPSPSPSSPYPLGYIGQGSLSLNTMPVVGALVHVGTIPINVGQITNLFYFTGNTAGTGSGFETVNALLNSGFYFSFCDITG